MKHQQKTACICFLKIAKVIHHFHDILGRKKQLHYKYKLYIDVQVFVCQGFSFRFSLAKFQRNWRFNTLIQRTRATVRACWLKILGSRFHARRWLALVGFDVWQPTFILMLDFDAWFRFWFCCLFWFDKPVFSSQFAMAQMVKREVADGVEGCCFYIPFCQFNKPVDFGFV